MPGSATYARDADVAGTAPSKYKDHAAARVADLEAAQREALAALVELWPTSAWRAAGARTAKAWLVGSTHLSYPDAARLERIAALCAHDPRLADAIVGGALSLARADVLARAVTAERAPFLAGSIDTLVGLGTTTDDDHAFATAVAYWTDRVDELTAPRRVQPHSLVFAERLFGGGDIIGSLAPVPFATVRAAVDAFTQDPDPADAPYQRTLSERRADGLGDLAAFGLTHEPDTDLDGDDSEQDVDSEFDALGDVHDTFDASYPGDTLDVALALDHDDEPDVDHLELVRLRLRRAELHRRRRTARRIRARSGVRVNIHLDLRTLLGTRHLDDLDDLVLRGDGWTMARSAAEQLVCDAAFVATLFDGPTRVLDANDAAERFSTRQRRAIAARDHHCVFPTCQRPPRHCDIHHLHERADGGPTTVANGCLLCRFHHRLLHEHGWTLHRDGNRWVATDPHGTEWKGKPTHHPAS